MSNAMSKTANVWIAWAPNGDPEDIRTLVFHDGQPRVYERNNYDPRIDLGRTDNSPIPCFRHARAALAFLVANPGKECQVDTRSGLFS